ncbi:hypothetical protein ACOBQJ_04200 [Pelotomaculum propionicicum]
MTLIELIFVVVKAKNHRVLALYLTLMGIVLDFESIILIFLKGYSYYPKILQNPPLPFDDVLAGNIFSQTSVAATALMVAVLNLKYYWYIVLAGLYAIIEESFLALGIYSQGWYKTWMTVALLPLLFQIAKILYAKNLKTIKPLFYYGYILLALFPLNIVIVTWGFMLLRLQEFSFTVLPDPIMSRHFLVLIHHSLISIPMMLIYFLRPKWTWKALVILMLYIAYYIAFKANLILIKEGWFLPVSTITFFWMYLSVLIMDKLYTNNM